MTRCPAVPVVLAEIVAAAGVAAGVAVAAVTLVASSPAALAQTVAPAEPDPTDPAKRMRLRDVNVPLTDESQAKLDELAAAVAAAPDDAFKRAEYGVALSRVGKTREALEELTRAAAAAPAEPKVQLALARGLWKANRIDESTAAALKAATSPLATSHDAAEAYRVAASCAIEKPETRKDAEGYFRKGIEREPKNAPLRLSYAALLLSEKRNRETFQELESAIRYATEPRVLRQIADLAGQTGRPELERDAWVRIAELRPEDQDVQFVAGAKEYQYGNNEAAVARLTRAVELDPTDGNAHFLLSQSLLRLGRFAEAEKEAHLAAQHGAQVDALLAEIRTERANAAPR